MPRGSGELLVSSTSMLACVAAHALAFVSPPATHARRSGCSTSACANVVSMATHSALREDMDAAVAARGVKERSLLQEGKRLEPPKGAKSAGGKGFGGGGGAGGGSKADAKKLAKELSKSGVVRIDGVLSAELADRMREWVDEQRVDATAEVAAGVAQDSRFADLVLVSNRCDLLLPLRDCAVEA
eukprot:2951995-Prymnesium_polylepis.1